MNNDNKEYLKIVKEEPSPSWSVAVNLELEQNDNKKISELYIRYDNMNELEEKWSPWSFSDKKKIEASFYNDNAVLVEKEKSVLDLYAVYNENDKNKSIAHVKKVQPLLLRGIRFPIDNPIVFFLISIIILMGTLIGDNNEKQNNSNIRKNIENIYNEVLVYQYKNGKYPESLGVITTISSDIWGLQYNYKKDDKNLKFAVWSNGKNKVDDSSSSLPVPMILRQDDIGIIGTTYSDSK